MQATPPNLPTITRCRYCGAPIRWAWSPRGRRVPLDHQPQRDGLHELTWVDDRWYALKLRGDRALLRRDQGQELFRFHKCRGGS